MTTGRINQDLQTHRSRGAGFASLFFAHFSAPKRAAFHRKPANLEAWASHLQSDTKNGLFGLDRLERFLHQKTEPDGAVTSVVTSSAG